MQPPIPDSNRPQHIVMPPQTNGTNGTTLQASSLSSRELFGGAITADLPADLIDASDLRQIPDNQEVLLSPNSDVSLILEVLEPIEEAAPGAYETGYAEALVGGSPDDQATAVLFHFSSIAYDNSAENQNVFRVYDLPPSAEDTSNPDTLPTPQPSLLTGVQKVVKYNSRGPNAPEAQWIVVRVALWRLLPHKNVDLVLSINEPLVPEDVVDSEEEDQQGPTQRLFEKAVASLRIRDWGLFATP